MSRVDFGAKPFVYPMPVLIIGTYDENGVPDAMNAAWGCITDMNEISISMSNHKTTENLEKTGAFTVSFATEDTVVACDYVGVESANKVPDKFEKAGFHAIKSENVNAEESILTDGKIDPSKLKPITYDPVNNKYIALGAIVGNAFSDGVQLKK